MIPIILKFAALFGVRLSPFVGGLILAGIAVTGFGGYSGYLFKTGYDYAASKCLAEALAKENAELAAEIIEKRREVVAIANMQEQDAKRAADAEKQSQEYQEAINATPVNTSTCLDRPASGRVRNVH